MSFLSSLLNIFSSFTLNIANGFLAIPVTKMRGGSCFTDMLKAVNYVDHSGQYHLGQPYGSSSILSSPRFTTASAYTPGGTTPPRAFPTFQPSGYDVPLGTNSASTYHLSAEGLRHLKAFEGLHQRPYIIAGQKMIGYGHRLSEKDDTPYVSRDQAEALLASDVSAAEGMVKGAVSGMVTQGQFDALVDFAYTIDSGKFKSSDVVKAVNGNDIPSACTALAQWCYGQQNGILSRFAHLASRRTANVHWMTHPVDPQPVS